MELLTSFDLTIGFTPKELAAITVNNGYFLMLMGAILVSRLLGFFTP